MTSQNCQHSIDLLKSPDPPSPHETLEVICAEVVWVWKRDYQAINVLFRSQSRDKDEFWATSINKQSRTIFTDQDSWSQSQMLLQATHMWPPLPFNVICAEIVNIVGGTELPSTPMVMAHPCADHSTQCYVRLPTCRIRSESQEESFWPPWTLAPRSNSCSQCQTPSSREHPTALGLRPLQTAALPHPDPSPSIRKTQVAAETCGGVAEEARTRACTRLSTKHTYTYVRNSTWYMYIALQCNRTLQYGVQAFVD